jgi:hypothetical protein
MRPGQRRIAVGAAHALLVVLSTAEDGWAQERPSEDDMFGQPAPADAAPAEAPAKGVPEPDSQAPDAAQEPGVAPAPAPAASATPAAPATPAGAPARDDAVLGGSPTEMFSEAAAPDDPLEIGGQIYLRAQGTALEGQSPGDFSFSAPTLLDAYLDARPNERVRGFVLGRMSFDPTLPQSAGALGANRAVDATGGVSGSQSLSSLFQPRTRGPTVTLDQLWLRFDIDHTLFVTAGKQHVRWGTGRFWTPADFLHLQQRNPLDVFDARTGTTMLKLHLPIEALAWNFYAYGLAESTEATPTLRSLAGALRAELVLGPTELGLGLLLRGSQQPRFAADFSGGLGDFDLYGELALRAGSELDRVQYAPNAALPEFAAAPSWQSPEETAGIQLAQVVDAYYPTYRSNGVKAQAVGGLTYSRRYNDNDTFSLGAEYFYNGLGYNSPAPYPGLVLPHSRPLSNSATFFYLGQQYAAVFLTFPAPYSLDYHTFTLSTLGNLSDLSFITRFDYSLLALTHLRFEAFVSARYGHENGEFRFGVQGLRLGDLDFSRAPALLDFGVALRIAI